MEFIKDHKERNYKTRKLFKNKSGKITCGESLPIDLKLVCKTWFESH